MVGISLLRAAQRVALAGQAMMGVTETDPGRPLLEGPVELRVMAYMPIPASWSMKKQRAAALGEILPISRPDLDNCIKSIKDGCNKVIWKDDSQVVDIIAKKRYGAPRVEIEIVRI